MSRWLAWPAIAVELGAVDQAAAGRRLLRRRLRRTAVAAIEHGRELLLDQVQGVDHLGDALAGEILEIAGLVDRTVRSWMSWASPRL